MKDWWLNLSLREKQVVGYGGILFVLALLYLLIWSPFTDKVDSMRSQIERDRELAAWMQQTDQQIQNLIKKQSSNSQASGSLLGMVQEKIKKSPLASHLKQMRQAENNAVQLSLQQVDFDQVLRWLIDLWMKQGVTISQITVTPGEKPGTVNAEMLLSN